MQIQMARTDNKGIFYSIALLTFCFILIEISFFIQSNHDYLYLANFVMRSLSVPPAIIPGLIFFLSMQFLVHILFCLAIGLISILNIRFFKIPYHKQYLFSMACWFFGIVSVLALNQHLYPNSKFASLSSIILFHPSLTDVVVKACTIVWLFLVGISVLELFKIGIRRRAVAYSLLILAISTYSFFLLTRESKVAPRPTDSSPNIFIIGMDSLRPDFLGYFGSGNQTPNLDRLLERSSVFAEAVTPLARTYPSLTSLLTGMYPRETGIRFNLARQNQTLKVPTLSSILQQHGYQTIFATDETRFSNIDETFGFDKLITPPIGLNDFLLGSFNDFPLSNILLNTRVGKWLFPYSYSNRAVYFTYNPNSFLNQLKTGLSESDTSKPMFMMVHFCLAHYPYLWSTLSGQDTSPLARYQASLTRVDQQVAELMQMLQKRRLLDKAIVVFLSDHGEAFELTGDRITDKNWFVQSQNVPTAPKFYPPSLENEGWDSTAGHGTDVLGLSQYHTLLAIKLYGLGKQQETLLPGVVSLLEVKPAILQLSKFSAEPSQLVTMLRDGKTTFPKKHIFLESDFSPESIRTVFPNVGDVIHDGVGLFKADSKTTRLYVKDDMGQMIIDSKQYADIYGEWMLALYPIDKTRRMPILVNLENGRWTNDLTSPFAEASPAREMLTALQAFYGDEIKQVQHYGL